MTKLKLTPEMLARIKNCTGFEIGNTFKYVPKAFREMEAGVYIIPKELWPVFTLRSKDGLDIAKIEDTTGYLTYDKEGNQKIFMRSGEVRVSTLESGIVKIKGLPLESGESFLAFDAEKETVTIDGKTEKCAGREVIKYLRTELQVELQEAINERSVLTDDEARGLDS